MGRDSFAIGWDKTTALGILTVQSVESKDDPFEAPILDVRPRVFIRRGGFEGLTVAITLRRQAKLIDGEAAFGYPDDGYYV